MVQIWLCIATAIVAAAAAAADMPASAQHLSESCDDPEGTNFLQMSKNSKHSIQGSIQKQTPITKVEKFDCKKYPYPTQMLGAKDGFIASELDVKTGKYQTIYTVPKSRVKGGYRDLNACGVNPGDDRVYCHMRTSTGKSYVVRLDKDTVEFVAKVPPAIYNTGGFSPRGDMFIATGNSLFIVVKNLNTTKGYDKEDAEGLTDYTKGDKKLKRTRPKGFNRAGDCVVAEEDLEGNGPKDYLLVLYGTKLYIAKWLGDKFSDKTWIIEIDTEGKNLGTVYGAGWNFQGKIMFASNEGAGVYQIPTNDINLATKEKIKLINVGKSDPNGNNDGLNCLDGMDPWVMAAPMIDCTKPQRPYQVIKQLNGDYALGEIDFGSGKYETKAIIGKNLTNPYFMVLNGVGINPVDKEAYGCLRIQPYENKSDLKNPPPFYIVRFNQYHIEYLAKVAPADRGDGIAGAFDKDGKFYVIANPLLYAFAGLAEQKGFKNYTDAGIPEVKPDIAYNMTQVVGKREIADFVVVEEKFDGGAPGNYLLAVNSAQDLAVVKLSKEGVRFSKGWNLKVKKVTGKGHGMNWGAAWSYANQAYFAQNDGAGLFKLDQTQIAVKDPPGNYFEPKIDLIKVGMSIETHDNDGLNCPDPKDPIKASVESTPSRLLQEQ